MKIWKVFLQSTEPNSTLAIISSSSRSIPTERVIRFFSKEEDADKHQKRLEDALTLLEMQGYTMACKHEIEAL